MKRILIASVIMIAAISLLSVSIFGVDGFSTAIVRLENYLYVKSGGTLEIETGGTFVAESGSTVNFDSGSTFRLDDDATLVFGNNSDATAGVNTNASNTLQLGPVHGGFADYRGIPNRIEWDWVPGRNGLVTIAGSVSAGTHDTDLVLQGTNASADDVSYATTQGGLRFQTDGANGDEEILWPYQTDSLSMLANTQWTSDKGLRWDGLVITQGSDFKGIYWAGLKTTNTEVVTTDADGLWFRYENDQTVCPNHWQAIYNRNGTDYVYDTGVTVAKNSQYHFAIDIDDDQLPTFYINGAEVASGTLSVTAGINFNPVMGVATDGGAGDMYWTVQRQRLSRGF